MDLSLSDAADMLNGSGSDSSWLLGNGDVGNPYIANQDPWTASDEGTASAAGNPAGGVTAATTPPSWLSQFTGLLTGAAQTVTTIAPLINGKPDNSNPNATGASVKTGNTTAIPLASLTSNKWFWIALIAFPILTLASWLFFRKKKKG